MSSWSHLEKYGGIWTFDYLALVLYGELWAPAKLVVSLKLHVGGIHTQQVEWTGWELLQLSSTNDWVGK